MRNACRRIRSGLSEGFWGSGGAAATGFVSLAAAFWASRNMRIRIVSGDGFGIWGRPLPRGSKPRACRSWRAHRSRVDADGITPRSRAGRRANEVGYSAPALRSLRVSRSCAPYRGARLLFARSVCSLLLCRGSPPPRTARAAISLRYVCGSELRGIVGNFVTLIRTRINDVSRRLWGAGSEY